MKRKLTTKKHLEGASFFMKYGLWSLIGVTATILIPFILGQIVVFQQLKDVNVEQMMALAQSDTMMTASFNTIKFIIITLPITILLGFMLAFYAERDNWDFWVSICIFMPAILPTAAVSSFFTNVAKSLHVSHYKFAILAIVFIWSAVGFTYIIYLSSLMNREKSHEEAARIDGATERQVFFKVVVPNQGKITVFAIIVTLYNTFRVFKYSYSLFGNRISDDVYMLQHFMYYKLLNADLFSLFVAADIFIICVVIFLIGLFAYERYRFE